MKHFFREIIGTIVLAVIIFALLQTTFQTFIVVGCSMEPSFQWTQRVLTNKISYKFHEPERGDVVVLQATDNENVDYIKRIIGLPGDKVEVKDRVVYVNDSPLDEPYIKEFPNYTMSRREVPENNYFVLGDNRNNSNDSHNGWTVPRENIVGKVWCSIWPPSQWGTTDSYSIQEQIVIPID